MKFSFDCWFRATVDLYYSNQDSLCVFIFQHIHDVHTTTCKRRTHAHTHMHRHTSERLTRAKNQPARKRWHEGFLYWAYVWSCLSCHFESTSLNIDVPFRSVRFVFQPIHPMVSLSLSLHVAAYVLLVRNPCCACVCACHILLCCSAALLLCQCVCFGRSFDNTTFVCCVALFFQSAVRLHLFFVGTVYVSSVSNAKYAVAINSKFSFGIRTKTTIEQREKRIKFCTKKKKKKENI